MRPNVVRLALAAVLAYGAADVAQARQSTPMADGVRFARTGTDTAAEHSPLRRRAALDVERTSLSDALEELHLRSGVNLLFSPSRVPERVVSCACKDKTVEEALQQLLRGTPLRYEVIESEIVIVPVQVTRRVEPTVVVASAGTSSFVLERLGEWLDLVLKPVEREVRKKATGIITGRVTDATTGQGISGVSVMVEGTKLGATTTTGGGYRITGVPAGRHTVVAVMLGYARKTLEVSVVDGGSVEASFVLEREAIALDELVVTGAGVETKVRAYSSPITVVNSQEIDRLAIQRPDQLFRGVVAGATTFEQGPYNYYASVTMRGKNSLNFDYIKTYVDGVEVTDPLYIATIDPSSIERIEILRGPQATTIYGAGASGGVMQIFTKKGQPTARPTLHVKTALGMIDGHWNNGDAVMQTDNTVSISGGGEDFSYNFGGSYTWHGEYVPGSDTKNGSIFGSLKISQGPLQATLSGRWYRKDFGWPLNPILRDQGFEFYSKPRLEQDYIHQKGIGLDLNYTATSYWVHNFTVGHESSHFEYYTYARRLTTPADTFYTIGTSPGERVTVRYNTSLQFDIAQGLATTLIAGADYTERRSSGFYTERALSPWGSNPGDSASLYHEREDYSGYFVQGTFGLRDRLFLTTGVRMDVSDNLGDEYGNAFSPRVGLAYSFGLEGVEMKARAAWGKGIKLPAETDKIGSVGAGYRILPNPSIGPEEVVGYDVGLEFQFRDRGKLAVTYYDQMAKGLIESVRMDGSDPLNVTLYQMQNIGEIANSGWEMEGELYLRPWPVTLKGTFATTKSVMHKRSPSYTGDIQIGDKMLEVPKYNGALTLTYSFSRGALALTATHVGPWKNYDWLALYGYYFGGDPYRGSMRDYWMDYDGVTKFSLNTSFSVTPRVQAYLLGDNLTNNVGKERDNTTTDKPRSILFGLRFTY